MKKLIIFFIILFSSVLYSFSQDFNPKYYSDYSLGFDGVAVAVFIGIDGEENTSIKIEEIKNRISSLGIATTKLSKKNKWLLEQALNEWEYEKDEYYIVMCADNMYSSDCIILFVKIMGKNSIDWEGYYVEIDKFKKN